MTFYKLAQTDVLCLTPVQKTYNRTWIAQTPMAHLLWNSSDSSRKQIFRKIFLFCHEIVYCMYSLELPHWGNSNEYTQNTCTVIAEKIEKISLNYCHLLYNLAPWLTLSDSKCVRLYYGYIKYSDIFIPHHPAKTQISLNICAVWSIFSLCLKKPWILCQRLIRAQMLKGSLA